MTAIIIEQGRIWARTRAEVLTQEVAVLETQVVKLEQKFSRTPALVRALGKFFDCGGAREVGVARFKLRLKREELKHFEGKFGAPSRTS